LPVLLAPAGASAWQATPPRQDSAPGGLAIETLLDAPALTPYSTAEFSQDGRLLAYVVTEHDRYAPVADSVLLRTGVPWFGVAGRIWITNLQDGKARAVTPATQHSWAPAWSPDGRYLAFLSAADSAGTPRAARLWVWERSTGTLRQVSDAAVREGYHGLHWTADWQGIVATLFPEELPPARYAEHMRGQQPKPQDDGTTVHVFEYDPEMAPEGPATDQVNLDLWRRDVGVINIGTGEVRRLSTGRRVFAYTLDRDRRQILYAHFARADTASPGQYYFDFEVQQLADGTARTVVSGAPLSLPTLDGSFSWSPDGRQIAYRAGGPVATDEIHLVTIADGTSRRLTDGPPSLEVGWHIVRPVWGRDGRHVYFVRGGELWRAAADGSGSAMFARIPGRNLEVLAPRQHQLWSPDGRSAVLGLRDPVSKRMGFARVDLRTGNATVLSEEERRFWGYGNEPTISPDRRSIAYAAEDATNPSDLWLYTFNKPAAVRVSSIAPEISGQPFGKARVIHWVTSAGDTLSGALVLPADYQEGKRYPLIVKVYGGSSISDDLFRFGYASGAVENLQLFATRGYALLLADSKLNVATPMSDLAVSVLPGIDRAIELGIADPDRIGVMGHSYGGYSTLSLIVQSTRFRAALMRAGLGNLLSSYGQLSDDGTNYGLAWAETGQGRMGGSPWEVQQRYLDNSPILLLDRVTAPLLIVHGGSDDAVPAYLADEVFTGLRRLGKRVEYARYGGEGHWEGSWSRANQIDFVNRALDWFERYLKPERKTSAP